MKMKIRVILFFFLILYKTLNAQSNIDSAKSIIYSSQKIESSYIQTCFYISEKYMDLFQYDSAQIWLSRIKETLPTKEKSRSNYFLLSRQAEIYYYNNLLQLGLQESKQSLEMAKALSDSLLIADSYNFLGLFSVGLDSIKQSIPLFLEGLRYIKQPPYPDEYLELTLPHHLYGNLAKAYQKLKMYDSSLHYINLSLKFAKQINHKRGIALAYIGLAEGYYEINQIDSAIINYQKGDKLGKNYHFFDLKLLCLGGLAKCKYAKGNKISMQVDLKNGFLLLKKQSNINRFYTLLFLNIAIDLLKKINDKENLLQALEIKSKVENSIINESNKQLRFIVEAGLMNEKRLISLQIVEAQRKQELANTRLILAIVFIIILIISFLVYRYYQNQILTVSKVRNIISQDLHDEVGASLSSLQIFSAVAEQLMNSNPSKALEMIQKIKNQSNEIMETMSDIVWSMKSNETGNLTLETKIKNYAVSILQEKNIRFSFLIQPEAEISLCSMKARRNILLIIRELLNNAIKYSMASNIIVNIFLEDRNWVMEIKDDGIGFANNKSNISGNGLSNVKNRCKELNGTYSFETTNGTHYLFIFPLQVISDSGW